MFALPFCGITLKALKSLPPEYARELRTLGDHLRKRRLDLKLTQEEVAKRFGSSESCVLYWEKNYKSPSIKYIPKIIDFLGYLPYDDLSNRLLGEKIVLYRQALGITQEKLARRLGVDPGTLAKWEKGKSVPARRFQEDLNALYESLFSGT